MPANDTIEVCVTTRFIPVTTGAPEFHTAEVGPFRVTDARFPPRSHLPMHVHARPVVAVVMEGGFDDCFRHRSLECTPGTLFTEPAEERHANHFHEQGARVLVVEPDPTEHDLLEPCRSLLDAAATSSHAEVPLTAQRLAREIRRTDAAAPLAIEGAVLELLAIACRSRDEPLGSQPRWLVDARDLVHARFRTSLRVAQIAAEVGVHPVRFGRAFRAAYDVSVATYVRRLRLEWAATELLHSAKALSTIALQAGFADQSHFTRAFRERFGVTPRAYRTRR